VRPSLIEQINVSIQKLREDSPIRERTGKFRESTIRMEEVEKDY